MASSGIEGGNDSVILGSEDLTDLKCEPCHEDGNIQEAVGMCVDCQDYLCRKCFDSHTIPKPCRNHQLLDKQQMLQSQVHMTRQDKCTERCSKHEGKIIKYYCTDHSKLACSICLNLDHRTCRGVQYIPDVAKDLANNDEYKQADTCLKSVLGTLKKVSEEGKRISEITERSHDEAVRQLEEFRKRLNDALDKIKTELLEKAEAQKSNEKGKMEAITDKYHETLEELETMRKEVETLERTKQHCKLYTLMMKTNDKLRSLDEQEMHDKAKQLWLTSKIQFTPNLETLDMLQHPESVGTVTGVRIGTVVGAEHVKNVNVKTEADKEICWITGSVVLSDNTLVVVDQTNSSMKTVDVKQEKVTTETKQSSKPWDITMINDHQVAVTLPYEKKVAFMTATRTSTADRTLDVNGYCFGISYKNGKLALSFNDPDKVQVLNLQGTVLQTIATDKRGQAIFSVPDYVTFGQDNTTLYVSNWDSESVVCVKLDGTVVATYTDKQLQGPMQAIIDGGGNVFVCGSVSWNIHKITSDCKKVRVLLDETDNLFSPFSISYSEAESQFYAGMYKSNSLKVYRAIYGTE